MRWCGALAVVCACARPATIQDELLADRDRGDVVNIRAHGWELWERLALRDAWASWPATEQVFQHAAPARPRFRTPRPFSNGGVLDVETLPVMFDVRLDPRGARHVAAHHLGERARLGELAAFPAFPSDALAVKLTWFAIHAHTPTVMPIWDGEPMRDGGNADRTWSRTITVDPDGGPGAIPLSAFIYRELDAADVPSARAASHDPTLAAGDFVALVAAHVTTKEIPDWTWQTYWWHDHPSEGRFAANRPAELRGAAANYLMDATYSTDTPCFNPWLEARFPDGLASNCVTCHQRAVVGAADYLPVTHGRLRSDDPYFRGHVATDFLWSAVFEPR
ncbi:MAG TPA: hypothetical protein VFQ65_06325 [Kofleriaceae bacterium]|nr:hypothetical protein [Kofleriaceae bacterium]